MAIKISQLDFSGSIAADDLFVTVHSDNGTLTTHKVSGQQILDFIGTNIPTGSADTNVVFGIAYNALHTAWVGTHAANSADSWARDAFGLAVAGTNAANQADTLAG